MSEGKAGHWRTSWAQRPSTGPLSAWPPVYPVLCSAGQQLRRSRSDHPEQAVGSCGQADEGTRNLTHRRSECQDWQQTRLSGENRGKGGSGAGSLADMEKQVERSGEVGVPEDQKSGVSSFWETPKNCRKFWGVDMG